MTDGFQVNWSKTERTSAEAAELSLVRMGRFVILASFVLVLADFTFLNFPALSLLALGTYVGYLVAFWPAVRTRRVEAVTLAVLAVVLAVGYVVAAVAAW